MDLVDGLRAFVATARTGSFTAAAAQLGISNRLTSKYVGELETRLGVRLLQRTTRKVGLSPAGDQMMVWAPAWLEELDQRLGALSEDARGLTGPLRVSAPLTFGEVWVQDMLRRFAAPHPELIIDLRLSDSYVDLASDGIDLAFRVGANAATALVTRKLAVMRSLLVATPAYLARHGTPGAPDDLVGHACIVDTNRHDSARWRLSGPDGAVAVPVPGRFAVNSARAARDLAVAGAGVAFCPDFILREDLAAGRLVEILPEYQGPAHPLHAVWLEGARLPNKVRALIDFAVHDARHHLPPV